jgi:hypothetical protein
MQYPVEGISLTSVELDRAAKKGTSDESKPFLDVRQIVAVSVSTR